MVAAVTEQSVAILVVNEWDIAKRADQGVAATAAEDHGCQPATVEKQNRLLAA